MKPKKLIQVLLPLIFILGSLSTNATHIIGGYMTYEFKKQLANGNYRYQVTIDAYRDCKNSEVPFDETIKLGVHIDNDDNTRYRTYNFGLLKKERVDPPGTAFCDFYPENVCIERGFYSSVIDLQPNSGGYHLTFVRCCRNNQKNLTDEDGNPNQGQTFYAYIPDPSLKNSSPVFSGVPSPFMCNLDTNQFLFTAFDKDGDSLVYEIGLPYAGGSPTQSGSSPDPPPTLKYPIQAVQYKPGYSRTQPFGANGYISVDRGSGFTELYSPSPGTYVVAIEVTEYRNGQKIGTVRLDMQILVLDCRGNTKPKARSVLGDYFEIEAGEKLCFPVAGSDTDDDNVTIEGVGELFGANIFLDPPFASMPKRTGYKNVQSEVCWTPSCDQDREEPYVLIIKATDDGCPEKFDHTQIKIKVNPFIGNDEILGDDTVCKKAVHTYQAKTFKPNSTFWWEVIGGKIISDSTGPIIEVKWDDLLNDGTIRSVEISEFGCPADTILKEVHLLDIPPPNPINGTKIICEGSTGIAFTVINNAANTYEWIVEGGIVQGSNRNKLIAEFPTKGTYYISLIETNALGCPGDTNKFEVKVIRPEPIIVGPSSVCPFRSGIQYSVFDPQATSSYSWGVSGGTIASGSTDPIVSINWGDVGTGTVTLIETDQYGCTSLPSEMQVDKSHNLKGQQPIGESSICEDEIKDYFVYESKGSVYAWDVTNGLRQDSDSLAKTSVLWGNTGAGRIGVQERSYDSVNMRPCLSPWVYLDVVVNQKPIADEIVGEYQMCAGDLEFTYRVNGLAGSSYEWKINGSPDNITGQGSNEIKVNWTKAGDYTIEVIEMSKDSCFGILIDSTVTVYPVPNASNIEGENVICGPNFTNYTYKIKGLPNSTFEWSVQGGIAILNNNEDSITVNWNGNENGELWVLETSENGCIGDTLRLFVYISELKVNIDRVSVGFPDDRMNIKWALENDVPFSGVYELQKRPANDMSSWQTVYTGPFANHLETPLNTDLVAYDYRIKTTDLCGNEIFSSPHTSILLKGQSIENTFDVDLEFSSYLGWENGVDRYELFVKSNGESDFSLVGAYNPGEQIRHSGNSKNYKLCYRIKATELNGGYQVSWSNEQCFFFSPNVFIPTAFTPDGDGKNDEFYTVNTAINTYKLQIYNRWGQLLFETEDPNGRWDGKTKGNEKQLGVYVAVVTFTDFSGKLYEKSATFNLLR